MEVNRSVSKQVQTLLAFVAPRVPSLCPAFYNLLKSQLSSCLYSGPVFPLRSATGEPVLVSHLCLEALLTFQAGWLPSDFISLMDLRQL